MHINGLPVVDATKPMPLEITSGDVKKGSLKDPDHCVIALAVMRTAPKCKAVKVHLSRTYVLQNKKWVRYNTGGSLRSEIVAFDRGGRFSPGLYVLRKLPPREESLRGKAHSKRPKNHPRPLRKTRTTYHVTVGVRPRGLLNAEAN